MFSRKHYIDGMGDCSKAGASVYQLQMAMTVQSHSADAVAGLPWFARLYSQLFQRICELAGALIPLAPGKPIVFTSLIAVNDSDIVGI